jgi:hypothetical protein
LINHYDQKSEWHLDLYSFNNPLTSQNDDEFQYLQKKVFNFIEEGKYNYDQLMSIANNYFIWSKLGIKFIISSKEFEKLVFNAFTNDIDYDLHYASFPDKETAIKNEYPDYYLNLIDKGEEIRLSKWQEDHQKYISLVLNEIEKTGDFTEENICTVLNSTNAKDIEQLIKTLTANGESMRKLNSCHQRLISRFMMDNSQLRIDKLKQLAVDIEKSVESDSLKSYIFKTFRDSYYKTLDRYIPQ